MASLDENGLSMLWTRIGLRFRQILGGLVGRPDRLAVTDSGGSLTADDALGWRRVRTTFYERQETVPEEMFPVGIGEYALWLDMVDETVGAGMDAQTSVSLCVDGNRQTLMRRHYGGTDPAIVFGNTRFTGIGTPVCQNQQDTGENAMVFYMDGMLGICLPDSLIHAVWVGIENVCITMDGIPAQDTDLVNLAYYRDHQPAASGTGENSLRQQVEGSVSGGAGAFAANTGVANGRLSFAANNGSATGEYSGAFGSGTEASGRGALVTGYGCVASGRCAAAFGDNTRAEGTNSLAAGQNTIAAGTEQAALGRLNVPDTQSRYAEIVGIGRSGQRANGRTLDWNGNEWLAGTLDVGGLILRDTDNRSYRLTIQNGSLTVSRVES